MCVCKYGVGSGRHRPAAYALYAKGFQRTKVKAMKTGIIVVLAACGAVLINATAASEPDLDPGAARGFGITPTYPYEIWDYHLKTLWDPLITIPCPDMDLVSEVYDDWYWNFPDPDAPHTYVYQIFRFQKPVGYGNGTLRWRIWGNSSNDVGVWRWNNPVDTWSHIDDYDNANSSMDPQYVPNVYPSWFNVLLDDGKYYCFILVFVTESQNHFNIIADVCDIEPFINP